MAGRCQVFGLATGAAEEDKDSQVLLSDWAGDYYPALKYIEIAKPDDLLYCCRDILPVA